MPGAIADSAANEAARRKAHARGRARLKALGIDVDVLDHEGVRQAYETLRAAYIDIAEAGGHMEPIRIDGDPLSGACAHARHGMLTAALEAFYGRHPDGWSPPRITWPTHAQRQAGARGR